MLGRKSLTKSGRSSRRFLYNKSSLKKRGYSDRHLSYRSSSSPGLEEMIKKLATESEQNLRSKLKIPDFNPKALTILSGSAPLIRIVGMDLERVKTTTGKNLAIQIGLCYTDINPNFSQERPVTLFANAYFIPPNYDPQDEIDWNHASQFIHNPIDGEPFKSIAKIPFTTDISTILEKLTEACNGKNFYMVGHNIYADINPLMINISPDRVIDTAELGIFKRSDGKSESLKNLAQSHLNRKIQGRGHPPLDDAQAGIELLFHAIDAERRGGTLPSLQGGESSSATSNAQRYEPRTFLVTHKGWGSFLKFIMPSVRDMDSSAKILGDTPTRLFTIAAPEQKTQEVIDFMTQRGLKIEEEIK